jgi:sulfatase maturation enzyme AslB (radical SAM superfamily)
MNKYFCSIPWVHLRLDNSYQGQTGVSPCCKFDYAEWDILNPENHTQNGILPAMNTEPFRKIRQDMLDGIPVKGCVDCYEDDKLHGESMRSSANASYDITNESLTQEFFHTKFIEVSLDNTCNLECKMCSSMNSTKLRRRDKLLGKYVHPNHIGEPDLLDDLDLSHVEQIKFVGGEPLLSKNHLPFLKKFPDHGKLSLLYNTNATIIPSGETQDIMHSVKELNFIISCDGIYKYNDYQRWGSNFETIIDNANTIKSTFDNINWFTFLNTFTLLNLNNYTDTIQWFKSNGIETMSNWGEGDLSVCHAPDWYEEWILESNDCPEVRSYFGERSFDRKYDPEKWQEFIDLIKISDRMYGTRLEDYNPELAEQLHKHNSNMF